MKELLDFDYQRPWPSQDKFPINEETTASHVREVLEPDIRSTTDLLIITGFTSLSRIVKTFGTETYELLKKARIVIGFDIDQRVSNKLFHFGLLKEVKEEWVRQGVSIYLCGAKINVIEKIKAGELDFRSRKRLHAKLYVGDSFAMLGSSNFSDSGLIHQGEANIRVVNTADETQREQYKSIKLLAENHYDLSEDFRDGVITLLDNLLKDAIWEEALARAVAEILENKWMKDFPLLFQALTGTELWPSQRMGIARAMSIIQDTGNVLLADPTGSGKTKTATTLIYTLFHWLGENGYPERSNALVIAPTQVVDDWDEEGRQFSIINKTVSMGLLSNAKLNTIKKLQKDIEKIDILLIDEAHNFLNWSSKRSARIRPKRSSHIILSTATPINKGPKDLLRLIELLDVDNLSDKQLETYFKLCKIKNKLKDTDPQVEELRKYINYFIVRRTKKELNRMISREPQNYKNHLGHQCKYPKAVAETYKTGETDSDKSIAREIQALLKELRGVNYLQDLGIPSYYITEAEKKQYLKNRFISAPALAGFKIKSSLRSSQVALYEFLYGTDAANDRFLIKSPKSKSGNVVGRLKKLRKKFPEKKFPIAWLTAEHRWICSEVDYHAAVEKEIEVYEKIGKLCTGFSNSREMGKAHALIRAASNYGKVLAFDSTVITLDYLHHLIRKTRLDIPVAIATGQSEKNKKFVRDFFAVANLNKEGKLIALCSDAMAEGISLPSAKALVLLDTPSVLRVIEQRIGRLERMDSEHDQIHVLWPDDSDEFSLNGDRRLIEILSVTDSLIRGNVDIPEEIRKKHLRKSLAITNLIKAQQHYTEQEAEWDGVKDSTQNIYSLIEGKGALINKKMYNLYRDVEANVHSAISFVESDSKWSFFCLRGSTAKSAKWLFIDERDRPYTDFSEISEKLKTRLSSKNISQRQWKDVDTVKEIDHVMHRLRRMERELLPNKKKRALSVAATLLTEFEREAHNAKDTQRTKIIRNLIDLLNPAIVRKEILDYDFLAERWLTILQPALDKKRNQQVRKRKILTLDDISIDDLHFDNDLLLSIQESCRSSTSIDTRIAACIIAVRHTSTSE